MPPKSSRFNVAEAKKSLSELLGRVAYGQETITILKRGRPMARLVPVNAQSRSPLAEVKGWLSKKDRFFRIMDEILAARHAHRPRRPPNTQRLTRVKPPRPETAPSPPARETPPALR